MRLSTLLHVLILALILAVPCGCASGGLRRSGEVPRKLSAAEVPAAIERAEQALAAGRNYVALEWMHVAGKVEELPPAQRNRVRALLEQAADRRIAELSGQDADPKGLAELLDVDLPSQVAVVAGIRAVRLLVERGEHSRAYDLIRKLDKLYPTHHERQAAGALLAEAGMALSQDHSSFWIFYDAQDKAFAALEYLVLNYPGEPRGAEAYWRLAEMYADDDQLETAIDRLRELTWNFATSPYVPAALARIPALRLATLDSPEYDRGELVRARAEFEDWLRDHAGHELEPEVRAGYTDCLRRLARSDVLIARFYRRVGNTYGARRHAERALEEADRALDASGRAAAEDILRGLPAAETAGRVSPPLHEEPPEEGEG